MYCGCKMFTMMTVSVVNIASLFQNKIFMMMKRNNDLGKCWCIVGDTIDYSLRNVKIFFYYR